MKILPLSEKLSFEESLFSRGITTPLLRAEEMGQTIGRALLSENKQTTRMVFLISPSIWGNALLAAARLIHASGMHVVLGLLPEKNGNPPAWKSLLRLLRKRNVQDIFSLSSIYQWKRFFAACQGASHCVCAPFLSWNTPLSQHAFGDWVLRTISIIIGIEVPCGWPDDCIPVQKTWCIDFPAAEILDSPIRQFVGERVVLSSFLPKDIFDKIDKPWFLSTQEELRGFLRQRLSDGHKGTFGRTLLIGGSSSYPGALAMAAKAALHSGCGLVTVAIEEPIPFLGHEVTYLSLPEGKELSTLESYLQKLTISSILVGNGWGDNPTHKDWLRFLITQPYVKRIIIDADGLNLLARNQDLFEILLHHQKMLVLTPHGGEMVRLLRVSPEHFRLHRWQLTYEFAVHINATLIQKDATTLIATPDGELWFSCYGNNALAKGGSGDILAGLIAGLMASGYDGRDASLVAAFLLGKTAEIYTSSHPAESSTPLKLLSLLPEAWKILYETNDF